MLDKLNAGLVRNMFHAMDTFLDSQLVALQPKPTYFSYPAYNMVSSPLAFAHLNDEKDAEDTVYLGFEWENEDERNYEKAIRAMKDSKLKYVLNYRAGGAPLELVSIPATMRWHKKFMEEHFFAQGYGDGIKPNVGCGMHIHISKGAFTKETLRKFIAFVVLPENHKFMTDLAGRDMKNTYHCGPNRAVFTKDKKTGKVNGCNIDFINPEDVEEQKLLIRKKDFLVQKTIENGKATVISGSGKSWAINTNSGHGTVEFRIFASPTTKEDFMKNLEFTDALVNYVRYLTDKFSQEEGMSRLYAEDFVRWLDGKDDYSYLIEHKVVQNVLDELKSSMPKSA